MYKKVSIRNKQEIIFATLSVVFGDKMDETDLKRWAGGVALAMHNSQNLEACSQVYDHMDITVLYLEGQKAFRQHVLDILRQQRKGDLS
jgi:hypothetical protein